MRATHSETSRAYCLVVMCWPMPRRPSNRKSLGFLVAAFVLVYGLTSLIRQLELDRSTRLLLPHCCAVDGVTVRCNILNLESHDVTAPELAIDRQIKHGQVAGSVLDQQSGPDRPNVLWLQWRLGPNKLSLV